MVRRNNLMVVPVEENQVPQSYVYFIRAGDAGPIKIGIAFNPYMRREELQTGNPYRLQILAAFEGGRHAEAKLHRMFAEYRLEGEWFTPAEELLSYIALHKTPSQEEVSSRPAAKWHEKERFDGELKRVMAGAKSEKHSRRPTLCRNDLWENKFKPSLQGGVAWDPESVRTRSVEYYDMVHAEVMAVLPPCRPRCRCEDAQ